jgi:hypothetical protein
MSDFYQILKREIEPATAASPAPKPAADLPTAKPLVENSRSKKSPVIKKKATPVERKKGKTKPAAKKKNITAKNKIGKEKKSTDGSEFLSVEPANPIWLGLAEAGKLGGVRKRTIKRALRLGGIKYRIVESRYQVDLRSMLLYFFSKKKLWNKLLESGIGQYVKEWNT